MIIEGPELRSKLYESVSPTSVKTIDSPAEISIIETRFFAKYPAMYIGIVSSAITKIKPTTLIDITIVKLDKTKISV